MTGRDLYKKIEAALDDMEIDEVEDFRDRVEAYLDHAAADTDEDEIPDTDPEDHATGLDLEDEDDL